MNLIDYDQITDDSQDSTLFNFEEQYYNLPIDVEPSMKENALDFSEQTTQEVKAQSSSVQCEFCSKKYSNKFNMQKHISTIHNNEKTITRCQICKKILSSSQNLKKHMKNVHEKKFSCITCESVFDSKYFLDKHNFEVHVKDSSYAMHCKILKSPPEVSLLKLDQ